MALPATGIRGDVRLLARIRCGWTVGFLLRVGTAAREAKARSRSCVSVLDGGQDASAVQDWAEDGRLDDPGPQSR